MRRTMHVGVVGLGHRGPGMTNLLSSLDGATFAVAPYADYMKDTLEKIDCSLIFEAE